MNLKQLEAFVKVAEGGSFSKAAKDLFLTQPTISAHISSLEKELNARLFVRNTKEVSLSDDGTELYKYAKQMIDLQKKIEAVSYTHLEACYKAAEYAEELGLFTLGSSDCHVPEKVGVCATYFPEKVHTMEEFLEVFKKGTMCPAFYKDGQMCIRDRSLQIAQVWSGLFLMRKNIEQRYITVIHIAVGNVDLMRLQTS